MKTPFPFICCCIVILSTGLLQYTFATETYEDLPHPHAGSTLNSNSTSKNLSHCPLLSNSSAPKTSVELYIMSKCPYGSTALLAFAPVVKSIGSGLNFSIIFIVAIGEDKGFVSLHGDDEVQGDMWELCAIDNYPTNYKYMDFLVCMNSQPSRIPYNAFDCSTQTGLDYELLKECVEGEEGTELLRSSAISARAKQISSSPTILINNYKYTGARTSESITDSICNDSSNEFIETHYWIIIVVVVSFVIFVVIAFLAVGILTYRYCQTMAEKWTSMITSNSVNDSLSFSDKIKESLEAMAECDEGNSLLSNQHNYDDKDDFST